MGSASANWTASSNWTAFLSLHAAYHSANLPPYSHVCRAAPSRSPPAPPCHFGRCPHSDLKPGNVLLNIKDGVPYHAALADWGAATELVEGQEKGMP